MKIIPAIDILEGKCVRLTKGDYASKKVYNANPLEVAKEFEASGIQYVHVVDLDGAKSNQIVNHKVLSEIASNTNLKVDFGGGVKSKNDVQLAFDCGVHQITCGSMAISDHKLFLDILKEYGSDKIILGADCKNRRVVTHGWQNEADVDVIDFIKRYEQKGVTSVICTDVSKDGMLAGSALDLYKEILAKTSVQLIASGGVSSIDEIQQLKTMGCAGVILGKAFYEGLITLEQIATLC
jgi:phosphoribosylformimino-5-aminoimidazole carboxamide ribotide isomerase